MKLDEVLNSLSNDEQWFRPLKWKGRGEAFCIQLGVTHVVPNSSGGSAYMTTNPELLKGDWEIVTPTQVLEGN